MRIHDKQIAEFMCASLQDLSFLHAADVNPACTHFRNLADPSKKRYDKVESACYLWDFMFSRALEHQTENLLDLEALSSYFAKYADYEKLLLALDERHRDHTIHMVWVMALGFYFLRHCTDMRDSLRFPKLGKVVNLPQSSGDVWDTTMKSCRRQIDTLWCLVALSHDLGYPIEKARRASDRLSPILDSYGVLKQQPFDYQFTVLQQPLVDFLLETLATTLFIDPNNGSPRFHTTPVTRLDFAKSLEHLEHGIMSAYLLLRLLDAFSTTLVALKEPAPYHATATKPDAAVLSLEWLFAVAAHSSGFIRISDLDDVTALLCICDELEEFSRYGLDPETDSWSEARWRTDVEITSGSLAFQFVRDNTTVSQDPEKFFKSKVNAIRRKFICGISELQHLSVSVMDEQGAYPSKRWKYIAQAEGHPREQIFTPEDTSSISTRDEIRDFLAAVTSRR